MSRKMPSMFALLGLVAVAAYKNRDKIKEMLKIQTKPREGRPLRTISKVPNEDRSES